MEQCSPWKNLVAEFSAAKKVLPTLIPLRFLAVQFCTTKTFNIPPIRTVDYAPARAWKGCPIGVLFRTHAPMMYRNKPCLPCDRLCAVLSHFYTTVQHFIYLCIYNALVACLWRSFFIIAITKPPATIKTGGYLYFHSFHSSQKTPIVTQMIWVIIFLALFFLTNPLIE